jgi:phosphomannomutase
VFGFEEALGYTVGPVVHDKDGVSAALWFADLIAVEHASPPTNLCSTGSSPTSTCATACGSASPAAWCAPGPTGLEEIAAAMDHLAGSQPATLGGLAVTGFTDYRQGAADRPFWLAASPLVDFSLEGGSRVLIRPSGTEPKLKVYADVRGTADSVDEVPAAEAEARRVAAAAGDDLLAFLGWDG